MSNRSCSFLFKTINNQTQLTLYFFIKPCRSPPPPLPTVTHLKPIFLIISYLASEHLDTLCTLPLHFLHFDPVNELKFTMISLKSKVKLIAQQHLPTLYSSLQSQLAMLAMAHKRHDQIPLAAALTRCRLKHAALPQRFRRFDFPSLAPLHSTHLPPDGRPSLLASLSLGQQS